MDTRSIVIYDYHSLVRGRRVLPEIAQMAWFGRDVLVTFIDDATGTAFATAKLPPANLPESFDVATTLHLGEADWSVIEAQPRTKREYTKSGSLTLRLRRVEKIPLNQISFSQLDITEGLDDHLGLGNDDWIATFPLNSKIKDPGSAGLPLPDAGPEEVYRVASTLSTLRESASIPDDGVYCPICHIASVDIRKLRTPCPRCGRALLKFGWS